MALPSSGAISFSNINTELSAIATAVRALGDTPVRTLFAVPSGAISMSNGYGKSSVFKAAITAPQKEMNLAAWATANGWDGNSAVEITINAGVYIWSDNTAVAALTTGAFTGGLTIINNGYIMGRGGNGAKGAGGGFVHATSGGPAISLSQNCTILNNSYIGGGGGGGAGAGPGSRAYQLEGQGGGGAGGGLGGGINGDTAAAITIAGGAIGQAGSNSALVTWSNTCGQYSGTNGGGGGGRIMPGSGGAGNGAGTIAYGGGAGGGGGIHLNNMGQAAGGGSGGSANAVGGNGTPSNGLGCGGGGGWGASGGYAGNYDGYKASTTPGAGGKAIALNGFSVTWSATGTLYGSVS